MTKKKETKVSREEVTIAVLKQQVERLEQECDEAYKEQEAMLAEVKKWIDLFPRAFTQLKQEAGEITLDDVTYHANLIYKILKHKYGHKPKMVEE